MVEKAAGVEVTAEQSPLERREAGRALRSLVRRSTHGEWSPSSDRLDPFDVLEAQAVSRLPELGPIRQARMAESPFAFYRGAAAVMAMDLAATPTTGIRVQACGLARRRPSTMRSSRSPAGTRSRLRQTTQPS